MNAAEKRKFIRDLTRSVRDDMLKRVKDMPECWDGIELRMLLCEAFASQARPDLMKGKRGRNYTSDKLERNL